MPMVLALVAHLALIAALTWGVSWQKNAEPVAFEAELWSSVVQEAAPRAVKTPPPPPPKVEPKPEPKPPQPEPKPEPKAEPKQPDTREADIAIEQAKRKKEEEAKKREAEKKEAARKKAEDAKAREEERKKKAEEAQRKADQKRLDNKIKQQLANEQRRKAQEEASAKARDEQMRRIMGQADATGGADAGGTAQRSSGPSASYKQKLSAAFKRNIVFSNPESISGNPKAEVQVTIGPTGRVMSARLTRSSGVPAWDSAVLRAAEKTTIPADENGRIPPGFPVEFGPKD
jgi:colicin import membrane protein